MPLPMLSPPELQLVLIKEEVWSKIHLTMPKSLDLYVPSMAT